MAAKLTRRQQAVLDRALDEVLSMDPNEALRRHLEDIASGEFVSDTMTPEDARQILKAHPRQNVQ